MKTHSLITRLGAAGFWLLASSAAHAESSFRGLTFSDTPQSLEAKAIEDGYTVSWEDPLFPFSSTSKEAWFHKEGEDKICAQVDFDKQSAIREMTFYPCFFNAQDLSLREITQQFVDKFGGTAELEVRQSTACTNASPFLMKGRTDEGELFEIIDDCRIMVRIKPGSGAKPSF